MSISAGTLDRRVTIQKRTDAGSDPGEEVWVDVAGYQNIPAGFEPETGREVFTSEQVAAFQSPRFTLRFDSFLTLSPRNHRIVMAGRAYDITGVAEMERRSKVVVSTLARAE